MAYLRKPRRDVLVAATWEQEPKKIKPGQCERLTYCKAGADTFCADCV